MNKIISELRELQQGRIKDRVDKRIEEFNSKTSYEETFKELAFCIMTANFDAERAIKIQNEVDDGFLTYDKPKLKAELKRLGYRFPNVRAEYIVEARKHDLDNIKKESPREWVVDNIKGLGYKEGSHFLRNIGNLDYAILDYHILDILDSYNIIKKPKTLTKKRYIKIEKEIQKISDELGIKKGELDLYLWYLETNKILK